MKINHRVTAFLLILAASLSFLSTAQADSLPNDQTIIAKMKDNKRCTGATSLIGLVKINDGTWKIYFWQSNSYSSDAVLLKFHNSKWAVECGDGLNGTSITIWP